MPNPASLVVSNYYAAVDAETCTGCGICVDTCQTQAIAMDENAVARVDISRCIGCGLCEPACPEKARRLVPKAKEEINEPTESLHQKMMRGAKRRTGKEITRKDVVSFGYE